MIRIMSASYSQEDFQFLKLALEGGLYELRENCELSKCSACQKKIPCYDLQSAILFCNKKLAQIPDFVENPVENVEN